MQMKSFADESAAPAALGVWRFWPLRFVLFFVVLIGAYIGCQLLPQLIAPHIAFISPNVRAIVFALLAIAILITIYRLLVQWTEKRAASELSAHRAIPMFAEGALIGFALFCAVIAVLAGYGAAHIGGIAGYDGLIKAAAGALVAAVGEEIALRGGVYRLLEEGFGTLIAVAISGAIFGLLHAANAGATTASTLAIALEAGILLAAAYALTRSLWLPIGLHFGWNFTEGGIFGAAVSGGKSHGLIATTFSGPDWLTGGAFGPEASVPAVILCLVAAMILLAFAIRRGEWKKLRFRFATG
jgi:membrane protease YdiL (CAAX protease family)